MFEWERDMIFSPPPGAVVRSPTKIAPNTIRRYNVAFVNYCLHIFCPTEVPEGYGSQQPPGRQAPHADQEAHGKPQTLRQHDHI